MRIARISWPVALSSSSMLPYVLDCERSAAIAINCDEHFLKLVLNCCVTGPELLRAMLIYISAQQFTLTRALRARRARPPEVPEKALQPRAQRA